MFSNEIDKLIIQHLDDLDDGARRLTRLQDRVADVIDETFNDWLDAKGWYPGAGEWKQRQDAAIAPRHWISEDNKWLAWFSLGFGSGDDGQPGEEKDYFWLTRLCKAGQGEMGLRFAQAEVGRTAWKKFLRDQAPRFLGTRFIVDEEPSLFLPVRIHKDDLGRAVEEEDLKRAFVPLLEAFEYIYENIDRFHSLLAESRKLQA
ncbi:hypothetical protein [Rhizobium leguminosarum]|uniref:hypothetical protein n=1 Tax=Rhizobium leguminosarum TaxID=384 RepID=UPI0010320768|nr:hypothetical protein [Rhizobium leguminosarum]TAV40932.1 hypothetical protein ELI29_35860 [Rhizobium leguminosarum]